MVLNPVIIPIQAKSIFHPMGEKAESSESRNKRHPQEFKLVNLWIWALLTVFAHGYIISTVFKHIK
jgi:hypothetical protein